MPRKDALDRRRLASLLLAAALLPAASACDRSAAARGDVLLISVDTLRPDHLGLYGHPRATSPRLDAWFADGAIFERAYTTEANTPPSVATLLTGRLPQDHGVRLFYQRIPDASATLPERLPAAYQAAGFVSNVVLTDEAMGLADRFDHFDDFVDERESSRAVFERRARRTTEAALDWLREARDPARPLFLWVHYIDPHGPYAAPASEAPTRFQHEGHVPVEPERIRAYQRDPTVDDALDYVDRYDAEIAYVDQEVDRLLRGYAETADPDRALVVFTADHGESMLEHERWFTHGYHVYEEIARVPLLIRGPGVTPRRDLQVVSLVDVAPTVLAFAGAAAEELPGRALLAPHDDPGRVVFVEATSRDGQWRAAVSGSGKWLARVGTGETKETGERRFYDLARDPDELAPQPWPASAGNGPGAALLARIDADPDPAGIPAAYARGMRLDAPKVRPGVDPAQLEALRALGYAR